MASMNELTHKSVEPPKEVKKLPVTPDSRPLAGAAWLASPLDLDNFGYVEEEYIVGGDACVYAWPDPTKPPVVVREDGKYRTRILVRKPKDPSDFSGVVAVESFNGSFVIDHQSAGWGLTHEHLLASGDAWVGYTKDYNCMVALERFDPERYSNLGYPNPKPESERGEPGWDPLLEYCERNNTKFPLIIDNSYERGLTYDALFQIVSLIKSEKPNSPLYGYDVGSVIGFGINDYNTIIAALHPYLRMEDNSPVIDGYLMYMSGEGGTLNFTEDAFHFDDERCCRTCDVPVIKIQTSGDLFGFLPHPFWAIYWRCQDSDEPGKQMRWYEIPGLGVEAAFRRDKSSFACNADYARIGEENRMVKEDDKNDFWNQMCIHLIVGAFHNLKKWIIDKTPPPRADRIAIEGTYPNLKPSVDELGNHVGGIRHTYLEVPVARFDEHSEIRMFSKSQLETLYTGKKDYVTKVRAHAEKMVQEHWILPSAVEMLVAQAEEIDW